MAGGEIRSKREGWETRQEHKTNDDSDAYSDFGYVNLDSSTEVVLGSDADKKLWNSIKSKIVISLFYFQRMCWLKKVNDEF